MGRAGLVARSASGLAVAGLAFLYAAPAAAASSWPPGGRMDVNSGSVAYLIQGGQLTLGTTQAQPPELKMRTFTLRRQGSGYTATFTFENAFQQPTSNLSGPVDYAVLLKLMPPGLSPTFSGLLTNVDHRALAGALGSTPGVAPAGAVTIAGNAVTYRVPAALGVGADWDVQAGVYWVEASGSGYYSLMLAANVAGLSGEAPQGAVTYARGAIPISRGQVDLTRLVATPPGAHLDRLRLVRSAGRVSAVASFAGPVAKLATINGQPTTQQFVNLALVPDPLDTSHQYAFFYDVLKGTLTGQEFKGSSATNLPPIKVTVSGREVSFDLGPAPTSEAGWPPRRGRSSATTSASRSATGAASGCWSVTATRFASTRRS